ncbi:MAG: DUF3999 family protein [Arenimonas sp.]
MNMPKAGIRQLLVAGVALATCSLALALAPKDFARQWPVQADCAAGTARCEGAYAVTLDESVYRQVRRADLGDVAAFNANGEALPFGPMPAEYRAPAAEWRPAPWFALPPAAEQNPEDLRLHVSRSESGELALDATLSHGPPGTPQDILVDVREDKWLVEALSIEPVMDAADFSVQVAVEASEDLESWRTLVPAATLAQLRQNGQALVRSHVEFVPQKTKYLRLRLLGGAAGIPLRSLQLLMREPGPAIAAQPRSRIAADFVRREGRAYVYSLPARVEVERVNIALGDDNAIASFSVSAREPGEKNWGYVGQIEAFRLRGAGVQLDNEAMEVGPMRRMEWRIESSTALSRTPALEFGYRPERWLLLTHGSAPFVVAAGSNSIRGDQFPLTALLGQVRAKFGRDWQPAPAALGPMQMAGGEAALSAYDPEAKRTWILWTVLLLASVLIIGMVLRLLKASPPPE